MAKFPIHSEELETGFEYPVIRFRLDSQGVTLYLKATGFPDYHQGDIVPPLAVAARVLAELSRLSIPAPGSLHVSQELQWYKPLASGDVLELHTRVEKRHDRRDLHFLTTAFAVSDEGGAALVTGKITILWKED